jgi:hypothetical protein
MAAKCANTTKSSVYIKDTSHKVNHYSKFDKYDKMNATDDCYLPDASRP